MRDLTRLLSLPRALVMGILNVTPDSFSDGGDHVTIDSAVQHALQMTAEGADIIDIGGESTRPPGNAYGAGAQPIMPDEEIARTVPVIKRIRETDSTTLISIDTTKSEVAESAIEAGADIINDVSGATADPDILRVAASKNVPIILMHGHGPRFQKSRIEEYHYDDVVEEVRRFLLDRVLAARSAGVSMILADVGIGFAKVYEDNLRLLQRHSEFAQLGVPMVLGVSRKSTIGRAQGGDPKPKDRLSGSLAAAVYGAERGARIIRTHDVKPTREALNVLAAILKQDVKAHSSQTSEAHEVTS